VTFRKIRSTAHYFILIPTNFTSLNPVGLRFGLEASCAAGSWKQTRRVTS
jgi:hypothetical protein